MEHLVPRVASQICGYTGTSLLSIVHLPALPISYEKETSGAALPRRRANIIVFCFSRTQVPAGRAVSLMSWSGLRYHMCLVPVSHDVTDAIAIVGSARCAVRKTLAAESMKCGEE